MRCHGYSRIRDTEFGLNKSRHRAAERRGLQSGNHVAGDHRCPADHPYPNINNRHLHSVIDLAIKKNPAEAGFEFK